MLVSIDGDVDLAPLISIAQGLLFSDIDDCFESISLMIRGKAKDHPMQPQLEELVDFEKFKQFSETAGARFWEVLQFIKTQDKGELELKKENLEVFKGTLFIEASLAM